MLSLSSYIIIVLSIIAPGFNGQCQNCEWCGAYQSRCLICRQPYYLQNGRCLPCMQNCLTCNGDGCISCPYLHYLTNSSTCQSCPQNCSSCQNYRECTDCFSSYYLTDATCQPCPENCRKCLNSTYCLSCSVTLSLQDYYVCNGSCVLCPNWCYCRAEEGCVGCKSDYYYSNGVCSTTPITNSSGNSLDIPGVIIVIGGSIALAAVMMVISWLCNRQAGPPAPPAPPVHAPLRPPIMIADALYARAAIELDERERPPPAIAREIVPDWELNSQKIASKEEIVALPSSRDLREGNPENVAQEQACSVCLEEKLNTVLECGHAFHLECLWQWMKKNPHCPLCRLDVRGDLRVGCIGCNKSSFKWPVRQMADIVYREELRFCPRCK